jgi:hypothetical protein
VVHDGRLMKLSLRAPVLGKRGIAGLAVPHDMQERASIGAGSPGGRAAYDRSLPMLGYILG